jgi:hypothetical protein
MALPWMHTRQPMASPFKIGSFVMSLFIMGNLLTGCVSYRLVRGTEGRPIPPIFEEFRVGKTTLQEALETLGAPDQVAELEGKDVLIYRRSLIAQSGLSFGIPLVDIWVHGFDFSAYGRLIRYDLLLLLFTPDGILREIIIEKGSHSPYLETILSETLRAPHSQNKRSPPFKANTPPIEHQLGYSCSQIPPGPRNPTLLFHLQQSGGFSK